MILQDKFTVGALKLYFKIKGKTLVCDFNSVCFPKQSYILFGKFLFFGDFSFLSKVLYF